jgi:hypothetical protein
MYVNCNVTRWDKESCSGGASKAAKGGLCRVHTEGCKSIVVQGHFELLKVWNRQEHCHLD